MNTVTLFHGDCLSIMPTLEAGSVDMILTDPPYFRVKGEQWDRQWDNANKFIEWMAQLRQEWQRVLKPNGSLYVFTSPKMAARVEVCISEQFNVLNRIRWVKEQGWHKRASKETLRSYLSNWEEIIFAEHAHDLYESMSDALHKEVYKPVGEIIKEKRLKAGLSRQDVDRGCSPSRKPTGLCYRWEDGDCLISLNQWVNFCKLCGDYKEGESERLHADVVARYERLHRRYESARQEYESLRRPFIVNPDVPNTDVWAFPNVESYAGKHPCEKPQPLLEHIILTSTKPDAVILDCFMGGGSTGQAARRLGRQFIGIELNTRYFQHAQQRIDATRPASSLERIPKQPKKTRETAPRTLAMELSA